MSVWTRFRATGTDPLIVAIVASVDLRFDLRPEGLAARIRQFADAAGIPAADYAARANLDDLYLASACAADDPAAWAECDTKHFGFLRSFAHRTLPDVDARDLADQVIADLWQRRKIDRYSGRSSLRTWLAAVVSHAALNVRRSAASGPTLAPAAAMRALATREDSPEDRENQRVLCQLLTRAVLGLAAEEKLLLHLYYEQGLTLSDMELVMRCSKATLSRRLAAIRAKLQDAVGHLASDRTGRSLDTLREGLHLDRIEFNLSALLAPAEPMKVEGPDRV